MPLHNLRPGVTFCIMILSVLGLVTVSGCADAQTLRERIAARQAARGQSGGQADVQAGQLQLVNMTFQGQQRSYYIHVPAGLQGQSGLPAVMVFHGGEGNGTNVAQASGMTAAADQGGFVAIFPNSADTQWNDGRDETRSGNDDVGFARAVIEAASAQGVGPGRVFAAGMSNGGIFVERLACDATGAFRAFAVVAANMPADLQSSCSPSGSVPMIFFNGVDDRLMPYDGGEIRSLRALGLGAGGTVLSTDATHNFWARAAGCDSAGAPQALADRANDGTTVTLQQATGCAGGAQLQFYTIAGGGHNWPGGASGDGRLAGTVSQDISATGQIVAFFERYGL